MSTIYCLDTIADVLQARIVKKFHSARTGTRFYRSCRAARDLVKSIKPVWPHRPMLTYKDTSGESPLATSRRLSLRYCRIEYLKVEKCSDDIFNTVVIPDMETCGGVETVNLRISGFLSEEKVQALMAVAKPQTVLVWLHSYDVSSPAFKNVKNLDCWTFYEQSVPYWENRKIFDIMVNRKTIFWNCASDSHDGIDLFLEDWLKGQGTDSLEKLTYRSILEWNDELVEEILNKPEIQNRMRSCVKQPDGWTLERKGLNRMRICVDSANKQIVFHFV